MATGITPHFGTGTARVDWVDTAKGLCIVLVVMMHATLGVGAAMGGEGFMHHLVAFAAPLRMPALFLVSGLFLARALAADTRTFVDRRILHFAYFYGLWLLIQSAIKAGEVSGGSATGFLEHLAVSLVEPYSMLWFVYMLAVFSVAARLLRGVSPVLVLGGAAALAIAPIETGVLVLDAFCAQFVYFAAGWHLAGNVLRIAQAVRERPVTTLGLIGAWALANGALTLGPQPLADLPGMGILLGGAGALAIVAIAAIATPSPLARPFAYAGRHSIAIYLAFFLPMAASREILLRAGLVDDVGLASLIVTVCAVLAPLVLERIVRHTPLAFLFERPGFARLTPRRARGEKGEGEQNEGEKGGALARTA